MPRRAARELNAYMDGVAVQLINMSPNAIFQRQQRDGFTGFIDIMGEGAIVKNGTVRAR